MKKIIEIVKRIAFLVGWMLTEHYFDKCPKIMQKYFAKQKCSIAAQWVKKYVNNKSRYVYLSEIHNNPNLISDHLMNVDPDTGEFFDLYGCRIPGSNIGEECSFRNEDGHRYVVIAFANEWSDFGWTSLAHALKEGRELNDYLWKTRG
jgi:hypothetical protein